MQDGKQTQHPNYAALHLTCGMVGPRRVTSKVLHLMKYLIVSFPHTFLKQFDYAILSIVVTKEGSSSHQHSIFDKFRNCGQRKKDIALCVVLFLLP